MLRISALLVSAALIGGLFVADSTGAGATVLFPGTSAVDDDPFLLNFDENGHATIRVNGGPATTLTGTLMSDPSNLSRLALTYLLPEPVVTGTVSFAEPGGGVSDRLRFTDAAGTISGAATGAGARMIFYSDVGESDLADTGPPANVTSGNVFTCGLVVTPVCAAFEGPEGSNGFDYRPGGVTAPANNQYVGISDVAVPEPASLVLFGTALVGFGMMRRRRRVS